MQMTGTNVDCFHLVAAGNFFLLWSLCITPIFPFFLVLRDLLQKLVENLLFGELHQVEPNNVEHPSEGFRLDGVEVEGCSAFEQEQKLVVGDPSRVQVNLQSQKKREQKLVTLIQAWNWLKNVIKC